MGIQVPQNKQCITSDRFCCVGCEGEKPRELQSNPCASQPMAFPQFWSAYVPCQTQERDALRLTLEQIDLIRRMCASYSELELVTSVKGRQAGGGC